MLARLAAQIGVVTNAFVNRTPLAASPSMVGVRAYGSPAHPYVVFRWSSIKKNNKLGRCAHEDTDTKHNPMTIMNRIMRYSLRRRYWHVPPRRIQHVQPCKLAP